MAVEQTGSSYLTQGSVRMESTRAPRVGEELTLIKLRGGGRVRFLWQDQPFEVINGGQLVAQFQNTAEYRRAQASRPSAANRDLLRQCPFDLRVGQEVGVKQKVGTVRGAFSFTGGRLYVDIQPWRLQGVGGQGVSVETQSSGDALRGNLRMRFLWQDQPFEILKDGQLVGTFRNTAEYWQAQQ